MDLKPIVQSKTFQRILVILASLIVLLLVFMGGEAVGFRKASYSYQWGERYFQSFVGPRPGFPGDLGRDGFLGDHGTAGTVLSVNAASSTLAVNDVGGTEREVLVSSSTFLRMGRDTISLSDLKTNERVVIVGTPDSVGRIEAQLIRVLPPGGMMPPSGPSAPPASSSIQ